MDGRGPVVRIDAAEGANLAGAPEPLSLYVHFPFCLRRCHYCDFSVARSTRPPVAEWLTCLEADVRDWFARTGWRVPLPLESLFVGGGTPSLLGGEGMEELARLLRRWFDWEEAEVEWTAEANPSSLSRETCERWRAAGVNRVSVGVQSFDERALRWLGRLHDAAEAERALRRATRAGFENVNLDLIFGLPAEVDRDWQAEVTRAIELGVSHVSAYGLSAEPRTPLGRRVELRRVRLAGEEAYAREYLALAAALTRAGFEHYEVSNFALPGHESAHNWHYWDGSPYLGLGPSAHTFLPPVRVWNVYRWDAYRRAASDGAPLREGVERLDPAAAALERVWLGLRTRVGLARHDPVWRGLKGGGEGGVGVWEAAGWAARENGRVRLTAPGWLRMDELVATLAARLPNHGG
ncbi:MAG: radical SAM family heme chaperone HemW [Gemmatimonadota bacterium]